MTLTPTELLRLSHRIETLRLVLEAGTIGDATQREALDQLEGIDFMVKQALK